MEFKRFFAAGAGLLILMHLLTFSALAATCYTVNITVFNQDTSDIASVTVRLSQGDPFAGTLVVGPQIGSVGPIPAGGQASFKLTGEWSKQPDNVVTSALPGGSYYNASVKAGCGGDGGEAYTLPGLPTNSHQGFILPPEEGEGDAEDQNFELWIVDAEGNGHKVLDLTPEEIVALPEMPESHQLVAQGEGFAFYVLDTGELQVNLGPTADGWYDVVVFDREFKITNTYRTR